MTIEKGELAASVKEKKCKNKIHQSGTDQLLNRLLLS